MAEIDRVKQAFAFSQLRNASRHQVGEQKKRQAKQEREQPEEPQDRVELSESTLDEVSPDNPKAATFGEPLHIDLSA